jgi:PKD repeat protein
VVYVADGRFNLLFGGMGSTANYLNDTWIFANDSWRQIHPLQSPPARANASMCYDAATGTVVLFGGEGSGGLLNDTWTFSNGSWTDLTASLRSAPSPRIGASFAFDPVDNYSVLFGGFPTNLASFGDSRETWVWSNASWTNLTPRLTESPPDRYFGAMVWDPALMALVLFSGYSCPPGWCDAYGGYDLNDTWSFVHATWAAIDAPVPVAYEFPALGAYDSTGGFLATLDGNGSTWELVGADWVTTDTPAPTGASGYYAISDDPADAGLLLFGGCPVAPGNGFFACSGAPSNRTWLFTGPAAVVPLELRLEGPDPVDLGLSIALFANTAGGNGAYQYEWMGLPPGCAPGDLARFSCTPTSAGNFRATVNVSDSSGNRSEGFWELRVYPSLTVTLSVNRSTIDLGQAVLFQANRTGGSGQSGSYSVQWTGLPPGCSPTGGFTDRCAPNATGLSSTSFSVADTSGGTARSDPVGILVNPVLSIPELVASASSPDAPSVVTFAASVDGGTAPLAFSWSFGDGATRDGADPICDHTYATPGTFLVVLTVTDAAGATSQRNLSVLVGAVSPAQLVAVIAEVPAATTEDTNLTLEATVTGGVTPVDFSWLGLPPGCLPANSSIIICRPSAAGTFPVVLDVRDASGSRTNATATVLVNPWPSVTLSSSSFSDCSSNYTEFFVAVASGGTPPYRLTWSFGDGAWSDGGPEIWHTYDRTSAAIWNVEVNVTDANGAVARAQSNGGAPAPGCAPSVVRNSTLLVGGPGPPAWEWAAILTAGVGIGALAVCGATWILRPTRTVAVRRAPPHDQAK